MPELPEVETVKNTLAPSLEGRIISGVQVYLPKMVRPNKAAFVEGLTGRAIGELGRHGKLLLANLEGGGFLTIHLGMTGQLITAEKRPAVNHVHVAIAFVGQKEKLFFRDMRQFGKMTFCPDRASLYQGPLANFGPDALLLGRNEFIQRFVGRKARIKSMLLDQRVLAGVGNIYADESLHRAGIHPLARPVDLREEDLSRLHQALAETLAEALAAGGSSVKNFVDAKGRAGAFQEAHRVYQRTGQPCPACQGPVERTVVGGRSTHFCPACQLPPK